MARALQKPEDSIFLKRAPDLRFTEGKYTYSIRREGNQSTYSVSDGTATVAAPIAWALGFGTTGQTYLFQRKDGWYETAVSFYPAIEGLDWTPGHVARPRNNPEEAAGRRLDATEVRRCIGCHSTDAVWTKGDRLDSLTPGVQCEQCHSGTLQHASAMKNGDMQKAALAKLAALNAEDLSNLCGKCHPSWAEVAANGPRGVGNVRHQVYRLTNSKCYDTADRRIACTACHDPHAHAVKEAAFYDAKCQTCHSTGKQCPVAKQGCVTCHMPKTGIPGLHFQFTDHRIRIARAGEKYPD
jgi:Cytochrome c3